VEEFTSLTEDIYSFFFTAKVWSAAFFFAIFVFCFQTMIVTLISLVLIDANSDNPLKIPPSVNIEITIAQAFALVLAVATQGDLLTAIFLFHDGYDNKRVKKSDAAFTFPMWLLACVGQFIIGAAMLVTIFILIVQSKDVVDMMLNFAALSFVSEIEDVAFMLAKHGFVSDSVEGECNQVPEYQFPTRKRKTKWFLHSVFILISAGLMGGWGYIIDQQRLGTYLPSSIFVQFGDAFEPLLASFSGAYDASDILNRRLVYVERKRGASYIAYCESENVWIFSVFDEEYGLCEIWNIASAETKEYDITKIGSDWSVAYTNSAGDVFRDPFEWFTLSADDCKSGDDDCNDYGKCENNQCV